MLKSCLLCGVGGQGTVLASRLIAAAAIDRGQSARTAETIGMAQRGGCVVSHVRIGDKVDSPLIPEGSADVIIGFEPAEAVRNIRYIKPGGTVIVNSKAVKPVTASLTGSAYDGSEMLEYLNASGLDVIVLDGDNICEVCGSPKVLNIALLAAAAARGVVGITVDELKSVIQKRTKPQFLDVNFRAVDIVCDKYIQEGKR